MRRLVSAAVALLLVGSASGCDLFGPSGPGTLEATVRADEPLGALVLELQGGGVEGFEARGGVILHGRTVSQAQDRHRVVLVAPAGEAFRFGIRVADLGADPPSVLVVSAVDPQNRASNARGIQIVVD